jgi:hypothetical protein
MLLHKNFNMIKEGRHTGSAKYVLRFDFSCRPNKSFNFTFPLSETADSSCKSYMRFGALPLDKPLTSV